jgi:FdhD protein
MIQFVRANYAPSAKAITQRVGSTVRPGPMAWPLGAAGVRIAPLLVVNHPPQRVRTTTVVEWNEGRERRLQDDLAAEEPLEIRVGGSALTITMRTPGDDFELAAGFLHAEGLVDGPGAISQIAYGRGPDGRVTGNVVEVALRQPGAVDVGALQRHFIASSSCGVCGRTSIDALRSRETPTPNGAFRITPDLLTRLPVALRAAQRVFGRTGGLHAAGLFDADGRLVGVREDIGRHNAVDKVIGDALLHGRLPLTERVLLVSGRGGFEIAQKALVAGVPVLASVSAPSSLAVQMARDGGLTLVGFLRDRRFVVYSHANRVAAAPARSR